MLKGISKKISLYYKELEENEKIKIYKYTMKTNIMS